MPIIKPLSFLSKHDIECRALDVLNALEQGGAAALRFPLDTSLVAEFLGLDVVWDHIPDDGQGPIAARILPLERLVEINEDMPKIEGGLGESTLAHEVGHWVLHIDQDAIGRVERLRRREVAVNVLPLLECSIIPFSLLVQEVEEASSVFNAELVVSGVIIARVSAGVLRDDPIPGDLPYRFHPSRNRDRIRSAR